MSMDTTITKKHIFKEENIIFLLIQGKNKDGANAAVATRHQRQQCCRMLCCSG